MFCRKLRVSEVPERRLWWTGRTEAHKIVRAETRGRRGHAIYQPVVVALTCHMMVPHWSVKSDVIM
jgi:hypothetical protein